jgi:hypothetical protein
MILASALSVAFFALSPLALGEPADEQYNFNPPTPGGGGGESSTPGSSSSSGLPGTGSDSQGPAGPNAVNSEGKKDGKKAGEGEGGSDFATPTGLTQDSGGSASPDRSALSAVTDSFGLGLMPIVLAAIAAIGVGGASIALWRRRGRHAHGELA